MPYALARPHVEEVIVEAFVPGRIGRLALGALREESENFECPSGGVRTRQPAVPDRDRITGQRKSNHGDAAWRPLARSIRDEAGIVIGVIDQIGKGGTLQPDDQRLVRNPRQFAHLVQFAKCTAANDRGGMETSMFSLPAPSMFSLPALSSGGATGKPSINFRLAS